MSKKEFKIDEEDEIKDNNDNLKIIESFSENDLEIIKKIEKGEFENQEVLNLRLVAEEILKESEITELLSYPQIKKNLEFDFPFQREGALKILRDMDCRVLLADEVGLGKTITSGIVLKECITRGFVKKVLILTPPSLVSQWIDELKNKFELDFKPIETENEWENTDFAIASLDKVKNFDISTRKFKHSQAHKIYWDMVIIDEAHKLKNKKTIRWQFVDKLQKKRLLLLTATPFQNDLIELYNLLYLLRRGHLGTISEFKKKFLHKGDKRHPLNPKELKKKLYGVMIRRRKDETNIKYKKRIPKIKEVHLSNEEKEIYDEVCKLVLSKYLNYKGDPINTKMAIYSILPKITSSSKSSMEFLHRIIENPKYHKSTQDFAKKLIEKYRVLKNDSKIEELIKIIENILNKDKDSKILTYTKHPATLKYISTILKSKKIKTVDFLGGLTREEKTKRIKDFKEKSQVMLSTDTGAEGLNFQFCSNIINYDLPWNPMSVEQRIGRLDRIGQTKNIKVYNLATKNTMEEHIVDLIINKMCCIGLVIGELPIILFNMGLDSKGNAGTIKFEERLMNAFLDSKNNLSTFSKEVKELDKEINKGIKQYEETKKYNSDLLD